MTSFAAIDFETANNWPESACSVGVVVVREGRIAKRIVKLIRPPSDDFWFTHIHGLAWDDVRDAPSFCDVWSSICGDFEDVEFIAAHNASFDRRVLDACCREHGLPLERRPWECTLEISRTLWSLSPARLSDVCRYLRIPLNHHEAGSDAEACAKIVIAAMNAGWTPRRSAHGA